MGSSTNLTGYYRYTDIWWSLEKVLPPQDAEKLKAILAYDTLVHPDHPLHEDGVDGAALFVGTFHDGVQQLMFSSKQVDYIRHWLHAVELTEAMIPLPYSECLLTVPQDLRLVSRAVYPDGAALKYALKQMQKHSDRLRKSKDPSLTERRLAFERARSYFAQKKGAYLSIGIESWEREHEMITELGWSLIRWKDGNEIRERAHLIVQENETYTNGCYVPEHRWQYGFGDSEKISVRQLAPRVRSLIEANTASGPLFLVFHDFTSDLRYLKAHPINAPLENAIPVILDNIPDGGIHIFDTSLLFGALEGNGKDRHSLEQVCRQLQVKIQSPLGNTGNDAEYTMLAFRSMASGEPVDIQRDTRWPASKGKSMIESQDDDSDNDDEWFWNPSRRKK